MNFAESPLKDAYRRVVWGPYRRALRRLPPGFELQVNRRLGQLGQQASRSKAEAVRRNLIRAFGERPDLDVLVRQVFETHFVDQYISWTFARIAGGAGGAYLRIEGKHHLHQALKAGRGAVLMHPHMGPAQLPLVVLGARNYRVNQVGGGASIYALSEEGERAAALRARLESEAPGRIWDGKGFLRPLLRRLSEGEIVFSAVDGTGGGEELGRRYVREVLGQPMKVPVGAVYLALKSGAPLLPLCTYRNPGPGPDYLSELREPLDLPRDLPTRDALEHGADLVAAWLHRWISDHPGDWHFWDEFEPGRLLEPA
ncbi:MAG: hypothetical protein H6741_33735 [Alphaproteobacteria bacterium]|nr:hypothetical protein [Alphaproteobacteria bacterium]MCB9797679.1 hypothetical protein [Alphaproteobacteria bacterium]